MINGDIGGISGAKTPKTGEKIQQEYNIGTPVAHELSDTTGDSDKRGAISYGTGPEIETISDVVFYIFDENGLFISKNTFIGSESYDLNFTKNGDYSVYVLCNISELTDLPATPTQYELESLTIPHKERYDHLPFAGKTQVTISSGDKPEIRIKLNRLNSAILIENTDVDRMELTKITVNGLPDRGNVFGTDIKPANVTYGESASAQIDDNGNAVVYTFMVPESETANIKIEAEATLKDDDSGKTAATVAPLSFIDRLETGKQATALIGYIESGGLKIGSPDNWGNVGRYELTDGVQLQVVGGE
ncbi:MAG: FimB/Mfa2 family fimbrial subunit, partial [Rikenellaceae bacterium]|nr:FimB/Mfa2 family fimbrial subunit [Rikenellaceae bacterium]